MPPGLGLGGAAAGLDATGIGGLAPTLGGGAPPGLLARGGGPGFGFGAGGGGFDAKELAGRELTGVLSVDEPFNVELVDACFFQGAAEPLAGTMPGNTATGLACGSAMTDFPVALTAGAAGAAGCIDGGRRLAAGGGGGGGGGAGAAFGFGGTNSR